MLTTNKTNSIVRSILGILLAAVLLMTTCPITAYAAGDNQGVMDAFPALGVSSDTMDENNGTISTLYGGGTIGDNKGTISSSRGTVYANHGSIESLSAGKVGTNYGTINRIENTGLLEINYMDGTVGFVGMGNEIGRNDGTIQDNAGLIGRNDGTIGENTGTVNHNYGTVSSNKGTVYMHSGCVGKNEKSGVVLVENAGKTHIYIYQNEGSVKISSRYVQIPVNTGNIEISNADVYVGKNYGNITLGAGAELECDSNMSSGVITKTDNSADISCTFDYGRFIDETATWYEIVFWGDDGKAAVTKCDKEENGVYYTQAGSVVTFTLPPEYECSPGMIWEAGNVNTWIVNAAPAAGSTEFTIFCHKCTPGDYRMTKDTHFQICAGCGKTLTDTEGAHTFGEFVSNDDATCIKDGTETGKCTVCGYKRTRTAADSHLTSDHHEHIVIDQRVEPTETTTGLTQGSHCEDCHKVLTPQEIIPVLEHTHNYSYSTVVTDPACTEKGYTTHICACGDSYDDTYVDAKGHTLTVATCTRAAFCLVCHEQIGPALGHDFPETWKQYNAEQHKHTCTRCKTEVEYEDHVWSKGEVTKAATHTEEGLMTYTCTKCGETKTVPIAKLAAHIFDQEVTDAKYFKSAATCTEAAAYYKSCICNEASTTDTFASGKALGHGYGNPTYQWNDDKCTATRTCTVCAEGVSGHTDTETVAGTYVKDTAATCTTAESGHYKAEFTNNAFVAQQTAADSVINGNPLDHNFTGEYKDNGNATHSRKCTRCDEYGATENHSYEDYVCVCGAEDLAGAKEAAKESILAEQGDATSEDVAKAAEAAIAAIDAATTVEDVSAAMEDGIAAIRDAKAGNVPPAPMTYTILDGANSTWTKGSTSGLVVRSDAPFVEFVGVKVDGKTIAATNYTAEEGSTIITLTSAYLETLETGKHSIEIVSADGSASTNFTVKANSRPADPTDPQTGDSSMIYLWMLILVVSVAGLSATTIYSRKRKN